MAIDLQEIGKRIRVVRGKRTGVQFGELLGIGNNMVSVYESGQSFPRPQTLDKIITLSGKPADWLLYGRGDDQENIVAEQAPAYTVTMPVRAMAGAGSPCCIEQMEPIGYINIEPEYDGPNIQVVKIRGTSMEPSIVDGAHVGIDVTDKEVISGQMYAVYMPHEGIVVKRIWIGPELVKIRSDNPQAPDHDMSIDRINWDTFVQGRVKWVLQKY